MSGGYFDYNQYRLIDIADEIERAIEKNNKVDEFGFSQNFSSETLNKFRETIDILKKASLMVGRIDWLLSGDDGEESFHKRWKEEIE